MRKVTLKEKRLFLAAESLERCYFSDRLHKQPEPHISLPSHTSLQRIFEARFYRRRIKVPRLSADME